ncbi:MAG: hypothetical protein COA78_25960 [Blastopirellula sp.]|nr:MAG: hypothetical protein COA78_25960 [Blastopirellula sp.]
MLIEGLLTTENEDGSVNVAPMGPIVDAELQHFHLRPFKTSQTYKNIARGSSLVFHVTDQVETLTKAAIGKLDSTPELLDAPDVSGHILADCCRWYLLEIEEFSEDEQKASIHTKVRQSGRIRDFIGFNRAKHAVIEAAILATRIHLLPAAEIRRSFSQLQPLIEKTGDDAEHRAFEMLQQYIVEKIGSE